LFEQEAKNSVKKEMKLNGVEKPLSIVIPPRVSDGQIFCLHKVKTINDRERN
jgi:hypothetical protein